MRNHAQSAIRWHILLHFCVALILVGTVFPSQLKSKSIIGFWLNLLSPYPTIFCTQSRSHLAAVEKNESNLQMVDLRNEHSKGTIESTGNNIIWSITHFSGENRTSAIVWNNATNFGYCWFERDSLLCIEHQYRKPCMNGFRPNNYVPFEVPLKPKLYFCNLWKIKRDKNLTGKR